MHLRSLNNLPKTELLFLSFLALTGLAAVWIIWASTPYGLGLVNDSAAYIGGANNLVSGNGYSRLSGGGEVRPITHFPPLFSIVLAGFRLLGADTVQAARWVIMALFGLNSVLVGIALRQVTGSRLFAGLGALLFAFNVLFIQVHSFAMSEPLFLFLSLLGLIFFTHYLHYGKPAWLVWAGAVMGLATLTRFVGLAVIGAGILVLLLRWQGWKKFLREAAWFTAAWLPFVLVWSLRNLAVAGTSTNRQVGWHPPSWQVIQAGIDRFWNWLLIGRVEVFLRTQPLASGLLLGFLGLLVVLSLVYLWRKDRSSREAGLPQGLSARGWLLHGVYIFVYLAAVVATITFLDATTSFEQRILAPAVAAFWIWMVAAWSWVWQLRKPVLRLAVAGVVLFFGLRFISDGFRAIQGLQQDGQGYAALVWQSAQTLDAVRQLPDDMVIYTNRPNAIYLLAGRGAYIIPSPVDPVLAQERPEYMENLNKMKSDIQAGRAVLVLFGPNSPLTPEEVRWYEELKSGLTLVRAYDESDIYGLVK